MTIPDDRSCELPVVPFDVKRLVGAAPGPSVIAGAEWTAAARQSDRRDWQIRLSDTGGGRPFAADTVSH